MGLSFNNASYRQVMRSASNVMCRLSMYIPWLSIVTLISFMIVCLAASMPSVAPTSQVLFEVVLLKHTPLVARTSRRLSPN